MCKLLIVTPVFEDRASFLELIKAIKKEFLDAIYVVAIEDGSLISSVSIYDFVSAGVSGELISLKRNVGHQSAIAIGLQYVGLHFPESTVVVLDSDGEDIPASIPKLLQLMNEKGVAAVVAERSKRNVSIQFKLFYFLYRIVFRLLTGKNINFGNYMALKPLAIQRLLSMHELWIHVAGCLLYSKLPIKGISIERGARYRGTSKMNFSSLVLHALKGMSIFSNSIVVRVCVVSSLFAFIALLLMPVPLVLKTLNLASPGWSSTLFAVLLIIFMQSILAILLAVFFSSIDKHAKFNGYELDSIILSIEKFQV
jgi:glycosyltransferase involved in cell wall biosynthesis